MVQLRGFKRCFVTAVDAWIVNTMKFMDHFLRYAGPLFSIIAIVLISGVIWAWFTFILPALADPGTISRAIHLCIAFFLIFNVFFNYLKTIVTPPGQPPDDYVGNQNRLVRIIAQYVATWVSNCVGFRNYRTFFLFMFWLWIGCLYVMASSAPTFFRMVGGPRHHMGPREGTTPITFSFILAASVSIAVGFLLSWHVYLILSAQTTIEWYNNRVKAADAKKKGYVWANQWDVGMASNLAQALATGSQSTNFIWWFLPTLHDPIGDGCHFPSRFVIALPGGSATGGRGAAAAAAANGESVGNGANVSPV